LNEEQKILLREYWDALFNFFTITVDYSKCTTEEERVKERQKVIEGKLHKRSHANLDNSFDETGYSDCESPKVSTTPTTPIITKDIPSPNLESPVSPNSPSSPTKSEKNKTNKFTNFNRFLHKKSNSNINSNESNETITSNSPPNNHYNIPHYKGLAEIKLDVDNILQSMKEEFFYMMSCDDPDSVALRFLRAR